MPSITKEVPLTIADEVRRRIPGLVVITGTVTVGDSDAEGIRTFLDHSWRSLADEVREARPKAHPLIAAWREALMKAGIPVKRRPPSIEAMARRAWKGDDVFSINPIVDVYNGLSMELRLPLGAWDLDEIDGGLVLRLSDGGEAFQPLGSGDPEETEPGEIVYSDRSSVLTRHLLWRQSDRAKITADTKCFVFVNEMLESMGAEVVTRARERIEQRLVGLLGADLQIHVLR